MFSEVISRFATGFKTIFSHNRSPYWIEITTDRPHCIYYFGDFASYREAKKMEKGYVEDLVAEQASGITTKIKRCSPTNLTITEEEFLAG